MWENFTEKNTLYFFSLFFYKTCCSLSQVDAVQHNNNLSYRPMTIKGFAQGPLSDGNEESIMLIFAEREPHNAKLPAEVYHVTALLILY